MIASAQIQADQTGRLAAVMEKKQKVESLWKLMEFYVKVNRTDDAYRITQQIEAMELGNYPPEATPHALGLSQAIPSPPPVATMLTMPTAMPPVPGFPDRDVPTQLPTHNILVPTGTSAVDAASSPTTATAATTEEQKTADDDNSQISDADSRPGHGCRKDEEPKNATDI
jgi:hypothetical protein